jgi:hypothetical protein
MPFIVGTAAEDVCGLVVEMAKHDLDRAILIAELVTENLAEMAPVAQPVSLNGILKATIKLGLWAVAEEQRVAGPLVEVPDPPPSQIDVVNRVGADFDRLTPRCRSALAAGVRCSPRRSSSTR